MLAQIEPNDWTLIDWHGVLGGKNKWKIASDGIYVQGESSPRIFTNNTLKTTAQTVYQTYNDIAVEIGNLIGLDRKIILATICTESSGNAQATRYEPSLKDWSFGLTQTLSATALSIGHSLSDSAKQYLDQLQYKLPAKSILVGGTTDEWKNFLFQPKASILLGSVYHIINNNKFGLKLDPVLIYASFNAGSPRPSGQSEWGIVNYGSAVEAYCRFYNMICLLVNKESITIDKVFSDIK